VNAEHLSPAALDRRQFLFGSRGTAGLLGATSLSAGALLSACTNVDSAGPATGTTVPLPVGPPVDLASALGAPGSAGLVHEALYQRRI